MVSIGPTRVGIIEGNFSSWSSLGVITLDNAPDDEDALACIVDCSFGVLYVAYDRGYPTWEARLATYQLPSLTKIQDLVNDGEGQYAILNGVGHGLFASQYVFMIATVSGQYIVQCDTNHHVIVTKNGVELADITPTLSPYKYYISLDAQYIVILEETSPYRIEVFQGN